MAEHGRVILTLPRKDDLERPQIDDMLLRLRDLETQEDSVAAAAMATTIHAATLDTTPLDADEVPGLDSSASFALVRWTWTTIKAFLKTYFDTLYGQLAAANTWVANNAFNSTATSGSALSVTRNLAAASTDAPVVSIVQDHASDDQVALKIQQDANISALDIVSTLIGVLKMRVINSSANAGAYSSYQMLNDISNIAAFFLNSSANGGYAGANSFNMIQAGNYNLGFGTNDTIRMIIENDGTVRAHDGTGGFMFVSKTGIVGSAQTIIANGTGDVVSGAYLTGWLTNSVGQSRAFTGAVANGGTLDDTVDAGANTIRFAVSAAGALTVIRQTGTATWAISCTVVWK